WSLANIKAELKAVRDDPVAALANASRRRRSYAGPMDAPDAPLDLVLDMPTGGMPPAGGVAAPAHEIVIPPLPPLVPDAPFFQSIRKRGFHGGLLDGLEQFYL